MYTLPPLPISRYAVMRGAIVTPLHRTRGAWLIPGDVIRHPDAETFAPVHLLVFGAHTDTDTRVLSAREITADGTLSATRIVTTLPCDTVVDAWSVVK